MGRGNLFLVIGLSLLLSMAFVSAGESSCVKKNEGFEMFDCTIYENYSINISYGTNSYQITLFSAEDGLTKISLNGEDMDLEDDVFYPIGNNLVITVNGAGFGSNANIAFMESQCSNGDCVLFEGGTIDTNFEGRSYQISESYVDDGGVTFVVNGRESKYISVGGSETVKGLVITVESVDGSVLFSITKAKFLQSNLYLVVGVVGLLLVGLVVVLVLRKRRKSGLNYQFEPQDISTNDVVEPVSL